MAGAVVDIIFRFSYRFLRRSVSGKQKARLERAFLRLDSMTRPNFRQRGYHSTWDTFAKLFKREHPLCARCLQAGIASPAYAVDHIEPLTGPHDPRLLDPSACQSLCQQCHAEKTATEDGGFGNRKGKRKPRIGLDGWPLTQK